MKARQFVNVVMSKYGRGGGLYSLSRIKPEEHLFYPSTAEALAAAAPALPKKEKVASSSVAPPWMGTIRIPAPKLRVVQSSSEHKNLNFLPFYEPGSGSDSKILCIDSVGHTGLCDADTGSILPVACLNGPKGDNPISFSISHNPRDVPDPKRPDALYVMSRFPARRNRCNFEALMYSDPCKPVENHGKLKGWHWHQLPPPPAPLDSSMITCHAVLDAGRDPSICVSSSEESGIGTYCFDTITLKWIKAGCWTLPFFGRAEHVPELGNLWFGISNKRPNHFIAMDLSSFDRDRAPTLLHDWQDLDLPEDWFVVGCSLVYLGAGRFCITKIFEFNIDEDTGDPTEMGAVISGVEVVHRKGQSELLMIKHKSKFYNFVTDDIRCVL